MKTVLYLPQANQKNNIMLSIILAVITVVILGLIFGGDKRDNNRRDMFGNRY